MDMEITSNSMLDETIFEFLALNFRLCISFKASFFRKIFLNIYTLLIFFFNMEDVI